MRPRDTSIHALIGESNELTDFYVFEPYGLSTADPEIAANVMKIKDVRLLETIQLRTVGLSEIMPSVHPSRASFLSIDVEGLDLQVLKTNDWSRFRPRVICVENWGGVQNSTTSGIAAYLNSKNYRMHAFTGLSEIYIANDFSST